MSGKTSRRPNRRSRVPRSDRPNLRLLRGMIHDVSLEQVIAWLVMDAEQSTQAYIAARTIAVTQSVASVHGISDETSLFDISSRVCAAIASDAMAETELGDDSGRELDRTLAALNRELSPRAGA
jgi:hypothetical protein